MSPGIPGLFIPSNEVPVHDHQDGQAGGDLLKYLRLDRQGEQTIIGSLDIRGTVEVTNDAGSSIALAPNAEISVTAGGFINTLSPPLVAAGYNWYLPSVSGEFAVRGGPTALVSKTADYAMGASDCVVIVDATAGPVTITLPVAGGGNPAGKTATVKKVDATANAVTLDGDGAETIDGAATQSLTLQYESLTVISDGSAWWIV